MSVPTDSSTAAELTGALVACSFVRAFVIACTNAADVGNRDGVGVGEWDGRTVGEKLGNAVVGNEVGRRVGARVGAFVGPVYRVGCCDGVAVLGFPVGARDGDLLTGIHVGSGVGSSVAAAASAPASTDSAIASNPPSTHSPLDVGVNVGCDCCISQGISVGRGVFSNDGRCDCVKMDCMEMRDGAVDGFGTGVGTEVGCGVASIVGWIVLGRCVGRRVYGASHCDLPVTVFT